MDGTNPKISFIPKGSLVREESFLERPRPRSVAGLIAAFSVIACVGAYAGFYFYNDSFEKEIVSMTSKINAIQQKFSNAPQVAEAQLFSSRASVATELLRSHTALSPVFAFLSKNTVESILYDKFSFERSADGAKVVLNGEAPTYAALAYQGDVLRSKEELLNFSIKNVSLTQFGTVSFALALTFTTDHLLYGKNLASAKEDKDTADEEPTTSNDTSTASIFSQKVDESSATSTIESSGVAEDVTSTPVVEVAREVVAPIEKPSKLRSLWLKFKFW